MKLNGRGKIMAWFGYCRTNQHQWERIVALYGTVIYREPGTTAYWADTEELYRMVRAVSQPIRGQDVP
jgi:hypothetical protein